MSPRDLDYEPDFDDWDADAWESAYEVRDDLADPDAPIEVVGDQLQAELDAWASGTFDLPDIDEAYQEALAHELETADPELVDAYQAWREALDRPVGRAGLVHQFENWKTAESAVTLFQISRDTENLWPMTKASRLIRKIHARPRIALEVCVASLDKRPDDPRLESALRCSFGACLADLDTWDQAQTEAAKACRLAPFNHQPYRLLARLARHNAQAEIAARLEQTASLLEVQAAR